MYLDPGLAGMAVQAFFAVLATLLYVFAIPRHLIRLFQKITGRKS